MAVELVAQGRGATLSQLTYLLVSGPDQEAAVAASCAASDAGEAANMAQQVAACMAKGVIAAVDDGDAERVAAVNAALVARERVDVCRRLAVAIVDAQRDDALGAVSWSALQQKQPNTVVALGATLIVHGELHAASAANVALMRAAGGPAAVAGPAAGAVVKACVDGAHCNAARLTMLLLHVCWLDWWIDQLRAHNGCVRMFCTNPGVA